MPDAVDAAVAPTALVRSLRSGLLLLGVTDAEVAVLAIRASGRQRPTASRAGRVAAAAVLEALGVAGRAGRDEHGRPVWPPGTTGAIAHGAGAAVAVAAPFDPSAARTLGIDLERADAVGARVAQRVAVIGDAGPSEVPPGTARAVCFSAKESAYKALSFASAPALTGHSFAGIAARCLDDGTFAARAPDGRSVSGRWWVLGGAVVTVAVHALVPTS